MDDDSPSVQPNTPPTPSVIKVAGASRSTAVAGAIAAQIREHGAAEVQAVGAQAINQAVKAIVVARQYLEGDHIELLCTPAFQDVELGGLHFSAIRFLLEGRSRTRHL